MRFQIGGKCGQGGIRQFVYDTDRLAFLERNQVALCVNGNWQVWVRYCGGLKGNYGFLRCKRHYTQYIEVGRLGSWTCSQHE